MHLINGATANDVWQKAFMMFTPENGFNLQPGRNGHTKELLHVCFCIEDPSQRWIVSRYPAMNPAFALAEVVWILNGREDSSFLNYFNRQLPQYAGHGEKYYGAYGFRLRNHFGIDQLDRAYNVFRNKPNTRQVVLQIWDGRKDLPEKTGNPQDMDIPCNLMSLLKVRDGKLEWMQINRSNDLFLGFPHNVVQFTMLQEIIAGWLNLELGDYTHISDSLHLYSRDEGKVDIIRGVPIVINNDRFSETKEDSERYFKEIANRVDTMIPGRVSETIMEKLLELDAPQSYQNIFLVLSAEIARRKKWREYANSIIEKCTNPVYVHLWRGWMARLTKKGNRVS